jgi:hypothetical protein
MGMKVKLCYMDSRETARIRDLVADCSTLVPTNGDDVFMGGCFFSVQNLTFDYYTTLA